jgi:hypothetical protein
MVRKASAEGWVTVHMTSRAQAMRGGSVVQKKREACIVLQVAPPGWVRCRRCTQALAVSMRGCGTTGEVLGYKRCVTSGMLLLRQRFSECGILLAVRRVVPM